MSQFELDSAVAEATGESMRTIRRRGFSIVQPHLANFDPEPDLMSAQMIDWDELDEQRRAA